MIKNYNFEYNHEEKLECFFEIRNWTLAREKLFK
jgi:hypothetical protein